MPVDPANFYEDDEPIEDVLAIIAREPDGVTERPSAVLRLSAIRPATLSIVDSRIEPDPEMQMTGERVQIVA